MDTPLSQQRITTQHAMLIDGNIEEGPIIPSPVKPTRGLLFGSVTQKMLNNIRNGAVESISARIKEEDVPSSDNIPLASRFPIGCQGSTSGNPMGQDILSPLPKIPPQSSPGTLSMSGEDRDAFQSSDDIRAPSTIINTQDMRFDTHLVPSTPASSYHNIHSPYWFGDDSGLFVTPDSSPSATLIDLEGLAVGPLQEAELGEMNPAPGIAIGQHNNTAHLTLNQAPKPITAPARRPITRSMTTNGSTWKPKMSPARRQAARIKMRTNIAQNARVLKQKRHRKGFLKILDAGRQLMSYSGPIEWTVNLRAKAISFLHLRHHKHRFSQLHLDLRFIWLYDQVKLV